jgi:K+ transporter
MESHAYKRNILLILVLVGTCTSIGDGILMPAVSVPHRHFFMMITITLFFY